MLVQRFFGNDFQGHFLLGDLTGRQIDFSKTAFADQLVDFVIVQVGFEV
jgi:hypothetical protein